MEAKILQNQVIKISTVMLLRPLPGCEKSSFLSFDIDLFSDL